MSHVARWRPSSSGLWVGGVTPPPPSGAFCDDVTTIVKGDCQALLTLYSTRPVGPTGPPTPDGGQHEPMQLVRCRLPGEPRESPSSWSRLRGSREQSRWVTAGCSWEPDRLEDARPRLRRARRDHPDHHRQAEAICTALDLSGNFADRRHPGSYRWPDQLDRRAGPAQQSIVRSVATPVDQPQRSEDPRPGGNTLSGSIAVVGQMPSLRQIDLRDNGFGGGVPGVIGSLPVPQSTRSLR